ncbi:hypothetical protein [Pseudomonas sp. Fl4BN1]|uniref:hypothetical protein n=1 Tax=Pseudomonas sp. Fl4BN1 TaxID=2697651 RepID=UPI001377A277|nr:hypothetical protein [Pseudomonas sp. Fl4BN1]NBF12148.1 hypothetical protein [Pseudomonas sp. Fl4BN1]
MRNALLLTSLFLCAGATHAEDPASVLGHGFGSLSCVDLKDPDSKATCGARALSNGTGCHGLSSQGMRDKCLDEALYPQSSSTRSHIARAKPPAPVAAVVAKPYLQPAAPALPEREVQRLEQVLGVDNAQP